jgi:ribosomal protein S18 acetylase RimI-like enzyme
VTLSHPSSDLTADQFARRMQSQRATPDDLPAILHLQRRAYQSEGELYGDPNLPPLRQTEAELLTEFGDKCFFKLAERGQVVGSVRCWLQGKAVHIERLMVLPERQGQGLGTALLSRAERCFPEAAYAELFTGHRSERNLRLYRRLGYREVRRQTVAPHLTLVFLRKVLSPMPT